VSTEEQGESGAGLQAQRAAIMDECGRRGWELVRIVEDVGSGKDLRRPGVRAVLDELGRGAAGALVVAKLDRLSRSMLDFAGVMSTAQKQGWALVALDVQVDTSSPSGEAMAHMLATFAQFERRLISERTKAALAVRRAAGVRLGGVPEIDPAVEARIRADRARGVPFRGIVQALNDESVPTARGGRWHVSTVQKVLAR
jgi:DNA invertase Pin-like site-specific DNA recombinase